MALKLLRDNLKSLSWILWLVVAAFVLLVFFEWGGVNNAQGPTLDEVAATVGDQTITRGELQQQYQNLERYYEQAFGDRFDREMSRRLNVPMQALNTLIEQKILLQEAQEIGLAVTDIELRDAILEYPVFKNADGSFVGQETYQRILGSNGLGTPAEFEDLLRSQILLTKLDTILAGTAYVSESAVEKSYRDQAEQAQIRFAQLPATEVEEAEVSKADILAYFGENQERYEVPEQRVADYLLLDTNELRSQIEIPDEELRAYYGDNQDEFTREAQVRARHILRKVTPDRPAEAAESEALDLKRRLEAGEDFATLAKEMSEDEVSAAAGGSLRPFGRGAMVPEFEQAVFDAEIGALVGPVKTDFGYHLIEVQSRTDGGLQPYEQVQAVVKARLLAERVNELAENKIRSVARTIESENLSSAEQLESIASMEGLSFNTTQPFGAGDIIEGLGRAPAFLTAAFELEPDAISEPIQIPRGWAILRLAEVLDPRLPELEEVEERVAQDLGSERRKDAARDRLAQLQSDGMGLEGIAGQLGLEVQESNWFGSAGSVSSLGANREVIDAALGMQAGDVGGPFTTTTGAVLFEVMDRKSFDAEEFEKSKSSTRVAAASERVQQLKSAIVERRRRDLSPQIAQWVIETFELDPETFGA